MSSAPPAWLSEAVAEFGVACREKLAGPGDREAAIRSPLETLLGRAGDELGLKAVFHDEVRDAERRVRPDYGVSIGGAIAGYVEVKAPGRSVDPSGFTGHDLEQWQRQRDLPNLLYTNGTEWRLFRGEQPVGEPALLSGGALSDAGKELEATADLEELLVDFLRWKPAPIGSVTRLVQAVAPLTRLLRSEVIDQLAAERRRVESGEPEHQQHFLGLASDWRALLFPTASDDVFADGYAQTVTFALLLARSEEIELGGVPLHTVGDLLGDRHSLMGRGLQLLTDTIAADFKVTLDLLVRVVGAVEWPSVRAGKRDAYLHLYERFLEEYDPELRKQSGSYYTPIEVVEQMVRLTEEALTTRLGTEGFLDENVFTVDPAMGTGTYLQAIIERTAVKVTEAHGAGLVRGVVTDLAKRLVGFELQTGPYAVAELRVSDLLRTHNAVPPADGMRLYLTNTLDDPNAEIEQLASGLGAISASRRQANVVKREKPVTVVIGNPPYRERAEGEGGWIESGAEGDRKGGKRAAWVELDAFRAKGNGLAEYVLKNLYVYFWRWGTWKVFDTHAEHRAGVVCFITTSGYIGGPGFKGMREYLRRTCSEGWVIDLSPEGMRPDVPTRVFPGVQQPLAIGIFVRAADTDADTPASVNHTRIEGRRADKYEALAGIGLDGDHWRTARSGWQTPFTPAAESDWDDYPALGDLLPWVAAGIKPNRTWVYAPSIPILAERWKALVTEADAETKATLFKETRDATLEKVVLPLPGFQPSEFDGPFKNETRPEPTPVRVGYRSFDRQWILADSRLLDQPRPDLWAAKVPGQVFTVEQHSKRISDGPGVVFSSLIPDMDHFKGSEGGRTLPLLHPDGSANLAPGLAEALSTLLEVAVDAEDVLAYVAAVAAHPGFTDRFSDELGTPGIRVPLTTDSDLFSEATSLGRNVVWLHTYGEALADPSEGQPAGDIRFPSGDPRQPLAHQPVTQMPTGFSYDADRQALKLGHGEWGPVGPQAISYTVGGKQILRSWLNYRKKVPGGKKTSPLDRVHVDSWPTEWTIELIDLLTVLTRLVELEPAQSDLLDRIVKGPIATAEALSEHGVRWPAAKKDRAPRRIVASAGPESLLD